MKVVKKQLNSRYCVICGLDNEYGLRAPFYNMEDGSVMTKFNYLPHHQSYPNRVHGGLIAAMLDELGLRALWALHGVEDEFGVTMSLETNYRKPVPYDAELFGKGLIVRDSSRFFSIKMAILDPDGNLLADGSAKYIKLPHDTISQGVQIHEEMPYLIDDGVTEIPCDFKFR